MPLTPEQQDLQAAIERCIANPSADNHATVKTMTTPRAILALLAQLEGCNEDYGQAVDSVAQLQEEVFEVRAQLEAQEAPSEKPFAGPGEWFSVGILGAPMREYEPGKWECATWPSDVAKGAARLDRLEVMIRGVPAQTGSEVTGYQSPDTPADAVARKYGASAGPDFGDRPLDRLIAAAPFPIFDMTKYVPLRYDNKTGPLAAAAALSQPVQAVPAGWRPMPIEPDKKMLQALANNCFSPKSGYADLLAAAPVFVPGDPAQ